jgi:hypothetical protein
VCVGAVSTLTCSGVPVATHPWLIYC